MAARVQFVHRGLEVAEGVPAARRQLAQRRFPALDHLFKEAGEGGGVDLVRGVRGADHGGEADLVEAESDAVLQDVDQPSGVRGHADACREVARSSVPLQHLQPGPQPVVRAAPARSPAQCVVAGPVAVQADGHGERVGGEQLRVRGPDRGEVGGEREADGVSGGGSGPGRVRDDLVHQVAGEQWFTAHETDDDAGSGRGLREEPVHGGERGLAGHGPGGAAEPALVGVAVAAAEVAGLHHVEREGGQGWHLGRGAVDPGAREALPAPHRQAEFRGQGGVLRGVPGGRLPSVQAVRGRLREVVDPAAVGDEQVGPVGAAEHLGLGSESERSGSGVGPRFALRRAAADLQQYAHVPSSTVARSELAQVTSRSYWRRVRCMGKPSDPRTATGIRRSK